MKKILSIGLLGVLIMSLVDGLIQPGYLTKSIIKIMLFLIIPLILNYLEGDWKIGDYLRLKDKKSFYQSLLLGVCVYGLIMGVYFLIGPYINLNLIKSELLKELGVSRGNFLLVALYISFVNSLLEEFFFRGFLFLGLLEKTTRKRAYILSSLLFAIYHIAVLDSWFNPYLFILAMTGLFTGGLIFNYLNEKNKSILNSWIVHMMANFAINHIGLMMFQIV